MASNEIKTLLIGNNPRELGCLSIHLQNFKWKTFVVRTSFDLNQGWIMAQRFRPDYILVESAFGEMEIKKFLADIRGNKFTKMATVALLKENNATQLMVPGVQDYLLGDNIESDTFALNVLNAMSLKLQEDQRTYHRKKASESSRLSGVNIIRNNLMFSS
jgi:hypothetical protein